MSVASMYSNDVAHFPNSGYSYHTLYAAEQLYTDHVSAKDGSSSGSSGSGTSKHSFVSSAVQEIKEVRKKIEDTLKKSVSSITPHHGSSNTASHHDIDELASRVEKLEHRFDTEVGELRQIVNQLSAQLKSVSLTSATKATPTAVSNAPPAANKQPHKPAAVKQEVDDDEEEIDLFESDEEEDDGEKDRIKEERLKAYYAKKSTKPALVAKSSVILDIKPWDDETDMEKVQELVRGIKMEGLVWGAAKLVPLAYGIRKLQIMSVVEDDKVSIEELQEQIEGFEDYVQSVDVAAFNKI